MSHSAAVAERTTLSELALLFFKLGTIGFGGPAAHIAMMEDEVVRRRGWLSRDEFLDYLGATNLIPGPNSTEMAIHVGRTRAGWPGLVVAGACFILPAAVVVTIIGWAYVRFGRLPEVQGLLYGVKPVVISVVVQAIWRLGKAAVKTRPLALLSVASLAAVALGVNELIVLGGAGGAAVLMSQAARPKPSVAGVAPVPFATVLLTAPATFSLWSLFGLFLKIGAVLFGSGYVLVAFLRFDFVERLHWLTESQLLDAVAVGQVTPGPVFTTATFIGYLLGRTSGAAVATLGIFLPAFVFVAASAPFVGRLRKSKVAGAALDGVNVASLALMTLVTWQLARAALVDPLTVGLALLSLLLLTRFGVNSVWLVVGSAVVGFLFGR